jgi:transposase
LAAQAAPALLNLHGVGPEVAGALLVAVGGNPERMTSEAAFAHLCGVAPLPASSGKTTRHRLNRAGNRQANAAIHRIVLVRLRRHRQTQEYMARRTAEGRSKKEIMRCLKRYVAREIFPIILATSVVKTP